MLNTKYITSCVFLSWDLLNNVYIGPRGHVCSANQEIGWQKTARHGKLKKTDGTWDPDLGPHVIDIQATEVPQEMIFHLSNHLLDMICTIVFL